MKNKYYVIYVEDSTPKIQVLNTKKAVDRFLTNFIETHGSLDDGDGGNWIDDIFYGQRVSKEFYAK